jgi:general secretion pathway protein G
MATGKIRSHKRRILFPWEGRGGLRRFFELGRIRPILIVLGILGFVLFIAMRERRAAGIRRTRATLMSVRPAIDAYMADHGGACPKGLGELRAYARFKDVPSDAWGKELRLICPAEKYGQSYVLESGGPDGQPGGLDRIR